MATSYPHQYGRTGYSAQPQQTHATHFKESLARRPFSNAANHPPNVNNLGHENKDLPPKPKNEAADQKQPASPPLPRQNTKTAPPSPPRLIVDTSSSLVYKRERLLGEGGFARVYEVKDRVGKRYAMKVVTAASLKTKKAKTKLYAEIKIHQSLKHPNVVLFLDAFEDDDNVYMKLELCTNGSMMDMLRRRRRFTEPESRFFLVQLIGACHFMHANQVIHRDLKLGNLFLDSEMNIKVGDFGLAALIENPGERKKTICGTPNYIAPEVLFDTANGHSFEVDTWSIGVILYTLVVGRPPFQTKDVKEIYKRIRKNEYEFPAERELSLSVRELIQQILTPDPQQRPTLHEIVDHAFFTTGVVPAYIPANAYDRAPDFRHISRAVSLLNLQTLRKKSLLDVDISPNIAATTPTSTANMSLSSSAALAQQEREFHRAVQPSSPISALLGAARQPFIMGPGTGTGREREQPLIRKLQAAKSATSPLRTSTVAEPGNGLASHPSRNLQNIAEEGDDIDYVVAHIRQKELEAQKARIVAQMAPASALMAAPTPVSLDDEEIENIPPRKVEKGKEAEKGLTPTYPNTTSKVHGFDAASQTLEDAFAAKARGKVFRDPTRDQNLPDPNVFIVSWVDYCNKYGMGYALTDGSVGVHFNDSTSIVLAPDKHHVDFITSKKGGTAYSRKHVTVSDYPEDLKSKVYLLKHFEKYIMDRLYGEYPFTFDDMERTKGMEFVLKYYRMKHVIVFRLSHDVLQFNFGDHTKIILSSQGLVITYINKDYELTRWTLSEVMLMSLNPPSDPVKAKFNQRLLEKMKYCKEVIGSIRSATFDMAQSVTRKD